MAKYNLVDDVSFLLNIKWNSNNNAWLNEARKISTIVFKHSGTKTQPECAKLCGISTAIFVARLTEMRKVAASGMTLK